MLLDIALLGLAFFLAIPAITGYFAYSHGKSFWVWFGLGCILPIVSNILLAILCWKQARKEERRSIGTLTRYEDYQMHYEVKQLIQTRAKPEDRLS